MLKTLQEFYVLAGRCISKRSFTCFKGPLLVAYSSEDKSYILKKINDRDLPIKAIGEAHANKILAFVEKNQVGTLEDLLNVSGIGPKLLRKVCDKILNVRDGTDTSVTPLEKRRAVQYIIPKIDDFRAKTLLNAVGIHVGHERISWALLNAASKHLLEWNLTEILSGSNNLFQCLHTVDRVNKMIPNGDIYIFEDSGFGRLKPDINKSYLTAMVFSSLQFMRGTSIESPVVALVKPSLKNQLYNALVGSERVSLQQHAIDIIEERSSTDCISVPKELSHRFYELSPPSREDMAQSLLLTTSFVKIILNRVVVMPNQTSNLMSSIQQ